VSRTHDENKVYIARYGKIHGPYSLIQIKEFLNEGTLDDSDLAWTHGMGKDWIEIEHVISKFPVMNKPIEEDVTEQIEKIFILLENEEFDFAHDLISGLKSAQLYETLFEGCEVDEEGELKLPEWVGWEEKKKTFFLQILAEAPPLELIEKLRQQTLILEHTLHDYSGDLFPNEIFQFKNLRVLRLWGGNFNSLPPEIGELECLEELQLESMNIEKLPNEFKHLKHLIRLDLTGNLFQCSATNLEIIGELDNLKTLLLDFCKMTRFPTDGLDKLFNLENISLQGVKLTNDNLHGLLDILSKIDSLREISLAHCGIKEIPEIKGGFPNLLRFDLSENKIESLPGFFSDLPNIKWVNLNRNPIYYEINHEYESGDGSSDVDNRSFSSSLSEIESRGRLVKTRDQSISAEPDLNEPLSPECESIVSEFESWINEVRSNEFNVESFDQKIDDLISFGDPGLLVEIVRGCSITKEGVILTGVHVPFPFWASKLFASTSLDRDARSEWEETGWGGRMKCKEAECMHYFLLRLIPYLPQSLIDESLRLEEIVALDLCLPGVLPKEIGEYSNLIELNLVKNKLKNLPDEFSKLKNLRILQLDKNELTEFPESIGNLKNLKFLSISENKIKIICNQIEGLEELEILDLSSNALEELPAEIANLGELQFLGLKNNRLKSVPSEIWTLYKLKQLWVGSNLLEDLPDEIYDMDDLQILGICENPCLPKNTEWVLDREVFLSSSTKSTMLIKEKSEELRERIKKELSSWD
jgi:Leucine-rich repeat (LRR) protein